MVRKILLTLFFTAFLSHSVAEGSFAEFCSRLLRNSQIAPFSTPQEQQTTLLTLIQNAGLTPLKDPVSGVDYWVPIPTLPTEQSLHDQRGLFNLFTSTEAFRYADRQGSIFRNPLLADLRGPTTRTFTFVLLSNGHSVFGEVFNGWEIGVKHLFLAQNQPVVAAGELQLTPEGRYVWNDLSGSFTRRLNQSHPHQAHARRAVTEEFLSRTLGGLPGTYLENVTLIPSTPPTPEQIAEYCRITHMDSRNARLCATFLRMFPD